VTQAAQPIWRDEASAEALETQGKRIDPFRHRLLVIPEKTPEKIGSIHVPDTAREKQRKGLVVRVGSGRHLEDGSVRPIELSAGDTIYFNMYAGKYAGTTVKIENGKDAIIIEEDDVIGVER
jgi:chaperonin GroES